MIKLRPWQFDAKHKALNWLLDTAKDKHFLINAAPGSGKTICACAIAAELLAKRKIDRVVVIAPRIQVVTQWATDFKQVTGRNMSKVTGSSSDLNDFSQDLCSTWSALEGLSIELQAICRSSNVLVICDEHHHAAVEAAWGSSADGALNNAKFVLVLTGTPIRSDGAESVWLAYDDRGAIAHPDEGTFTLTYGQAVDLGYCRPVAFHRHYGSFNVDIEGEGIKVNSDQKIDLPSTLKKIPGIQRSLDFYRLAKTPKFDASTNKASIDSYQGSMLMGAIEKLDVLRAQMPQAGGLVIAPSIPVAEYMCELLEELDGEKPVIVHSQMNNAEDKIVAFRNSNRRWLVSVAMVSEGVDIPRLRVLVYLPNPLTELAFRQAIGRVVRTFGPDDFSSAQVVLPALSIFDTYARRIEKEMPDHVKKAIRETSEKICPSCNASVPFNSKVCECGHIFTTTISKTKACHECGTLNPYSASECFHCGAGFLNEFSITLEEALRVGAIVRGMDLEEWEVQESEEMAPSMRTALLSSGDENLIRILRTFPEQSLTRLKSILNSA